MDPAVAVRRGETDQHIRLKRLALVWAQANGYSACAAEVSLPQCRYRADVAAYRSEGKGHGATAIFECKQARSDLRRDNCRTAAALERLRSLSRRREVLEKHLRVHYPTLRTGDSLFPEYDSHDFAAIGHRGTDASCANSQRCKIIFMAEPSSSVSCGIGARTCSSWSCLTSCFGKQRCRRVGACWSRQIIHSACERRPVWHDNAAETRLRLLHRIARAGTRQFNRQFGISFEEIQSARPAG